MNVGSKTITDSGGGSANYTRIGAGTVVQVDYDEPEVTNGSERFVDRDTDV